jgi:hypothetical protein
MSSSSDGNGQLMEISKEANKNHTANPVRLETLRSLIVASNS